MEPRNGAPEAKAPGLDGAVGDGHAGQHDDDDDHRRPDLDDGGEGAAAAAFAFAAGHGRVHRAWGGKEASAWPGTGGERWDHVLPFNLRCSIFDWLAEFFSRVTPAAGDQTPLAARFPAKEPPPPQRPSSYCGAFTGSCRLDPPTHSPPGALLPPTPQL